MRLSQPRQKPDAISRGIELFEGIAEVFAYCKG